MPEPISRRDQRFESLFDRWNLTYEFIPELGLTDELKVLDDAQVRAQPDIAPPERVDEYALQMKYGALMPPIVVAAHLLAAKDVLIDGNTRARAARKNRETAFPAYRVSPIPDARFAKFLGAALNNIGGVRLEREAARKSALEGIDMGLTDDQIALEIGYSAESVRRWRRDQQFNERTEKLNLTEMAAKLTNTQKRGIAKIAHDEPFGALVQLVVTNKPTEPDLKELLEKVGQASSDSEAMELVNTAKDVWHPIGPPPQKVHRNKAAQSARMFLGGLLKIGDPAQVYDATKAEDDFRKWADALSFVQSVLAVFEQHRGVDGKLA
jgi:hypothetical protein